ncbi:hypothetical protein NDU88_007698 [Pleurodeles waltl]|uniref:exodeoxyribonuclease III n=1 Tax=Pleurodeles waltl TaxID=8319 RepID=A0AAV7RRP7_PLEWA|nr:hypothetical protein NDU88_007698 [Pleurodeles waltl]
MGSPAKRHKVLAYLKRRGIHVAMLQETHLTTNEVEKFKRRCRGQVFATGYSSYSRGALIWIRAGVPFEARSIEVDREGRFVVVEGRLHGIPIMLGSIYAPNQDQAPFLQRLSSRITCQQNGDLLIGGDFNSVMNVDSDRSLPPLQGAVTHKTTKKVREWVEVWGMVDIWREQHPNEKDYTFYSALHQLHTRIDRVVCTTGIARGIFHTEYLGRTISDHNPLLVRWRLDEDRPPIPIWRLPPTALEDQTFRENLRSHLADQININKGSTSSRYLEWEALKVEVRGYSIGQTVGIKRTLEQEVIKLEGAIHSWEKKVHKSAQEREEYEQVMKSYSCAEEQLRCHCLQKHLATVQAEEGRSGKMLAWLVKAGGEGTPIL